MEACCLLLHPSLLHPCLLHPCLHSIAFASECQSWWTSLSQGSQQRDPFALILTDVLLLPGMACRQGQQRKTCHRLGLTAKRNIVTGWAGQQRETLLQAGLEGSEWLDHHGTSPLKEQFQDSITPVVSVNPYLSLSSLPRNPVFQC